MYLLVRLSQLAGIFDPEVEPALPLDSSLYTKIERWIRYGSKPQGFSVSRTKHGVLPEGYGLNFQIGGIHLGSEYHHFHRFITLCRNRISTAGEHLHCYENFIAATIVDEICQKKPPEEILHTVKATAASAQLDTRQEFKEDQLLPYCQHVVQGVLRVADNLDDDPYLDGVRNFFCRHSPGESDTLAGALTPSFGL